MPVNVDNMARDVRYCSASDCSNRLHMVLAPRPGRLPCRRICFTSQQELGTTTSLHPLEPLSGVELQDAIRLLKTLPIFTPSTRIISVILREPEKFLVYEWKCGSCGDRQADAVLFDNALNSACTARVNLSAGSVIDWKAAPAGVQSTLSMDEQIECEQAVLASAEFQEALDRHYGITDMRFVMVDIWSAGKYGSEEDRTRRLTNRQRIRQADRRNPSSCRPEQYAGYSGRGIRPLAASAAGGQLCCDARTGPAHRHQTSGDYAARGPKLLPRRSAIEVAELELGSRFQCA